MGTESVKISKAALQFNDPNCFAAVKSNGDATSLDMCVYSGGVIKDHWWWGDLAVDLSGMSFPKKKMPILEDHRTEKKIGFSTKMSVENNQLTVAEMSYIDTPESLAFRANSAAGFPYEASMYAQPTSIETVSDGQEVEVNGYTFKGPGTIWRKSTFKEASICTFGYDPNTKSVAMSEGEEVINLEYVGEQSKQLNREEDKKPMNKEQFKTDHPEEYAKLVGEIQSQFEVTKVELENKLANAVSEKEKLSAENISLEKRVIQIEKNDTLRAEREISSTADSIFTAQFNAVGLPERLFSKVRKLVSHNEFVKDGSLDREAFKAAVDAELKDWEPAEGETQVFGLGSGTKHVVEDGKSEKEVDSIVSRMLGYVGQESNKA